MKIAYLIKLRPGLEDLIPFDAVRIEVGEDGLYSEHDLARLQNCQYPPTV